MPLLKVEHSWKNVWLVDEGAFGKSIATSQSSIDNKKSAFLPCEKKFNNVQSINQQSHDHDATNNIISVDDVNILTRGRAFVPAAIEQRNRSHITEAQVNQTRQISKQSIRI